MRIRATLLLACVFATAQAQEPASSDRFYQAIRSNDLVALRALVKAQGTAVTDRTGQTPLLMASAYGSESAVQLLVEAGADVKAASGAGLTPLHAAAGDIRKVRILLDAGADVNAATGQGRTPLIVAAATSGTLETVRQLLARGADVNAADVNGVTPLIAAASVGSMAVASLLLDRGANPSAAAPGVTGAASALMSAGYNGDAVLTRALLARKADVGAVSGDRSGNVKNGAVAFGEVTALHMAVAGGNADAVSLVLDAGAAVDARDVRGMTPLMWAIGTDRPNVRIVRLLLDRGADITVISKAGEHALDWARKFNNPAVLQVLKLSPVPQGETLPPVEPAASHTARAAAELSLGALRPMRTASARMMRDGGCVACHAQPVTAMATDAAAARGWSVERNADEIAQSTQSLTGGVQTLLQGREAGGFPDIPLYVSLMLAAIKAPPSPATDAVVFYLAAKQRDAGNWHGMGATRAPMQDGDFSRTAMAIRTLAVYGMPARQEEMTDRVARAATWLSVQTPLTTEDRVMQLLGVHWAGVSDSVMAARMRELLSLQRADGGWAQTPHLASDAYATGQALYTLRELGIAATDPALQRAAAFLLRTQAGDGTWFVKSRAMKIQPYFESGFPYGHDQWISQAGSAWAVMGLSAAAADAPLRSGNTR
ncbi:MAG: hypothetical protein FJW14_01990 [Acidimicrobiia bacterium]|nr:hypothetical protein [Acidimicrobiia bacterium]